MFYAALVVWETLRCDCRTVRRTGPKADRGTTAGQNIAYQSCRCVRADAGRIPDIVFRVIAVDVERFGAEGVLQVRKTLNIEKCRGVKKRSRPHRGFGVSIIKRHAGDALQRRYIQRQFDAERRGDVAISRRVIVQGDAMIPLIAAPGGFVPDADSTRKSQGGNLLRY